MPRFVIFTTHPIQYQAPWFRALAATKNLDLEVVFSYLPDAYQQGVGFGESFQWDIPLLDGYSYRFLRTIKLPHPVPDFARFVATGIAQALDEIQPDAAMILGWQEISLVQALIACRQRRIPVILRGESNAMRKRSAPVSMLHRHYFAMFDAFLAIGRANADLYRMAGVPQSKILTAGYCVENERFASAAKHLQAVRREIRRGWNVKDNVTCFGFVGKLEPKKRPLDFILALKKAQANGVQLHGLIVGSGELMDRARRLVAADDLRVTFTGFLNQSEIPEAYAAIDALVLPSDYGETWGLVINEAMASGRPAIVSDRIGSANDLVIEGYTGIVFPFGEVVALSTAMKEFALDARISHAMGAAAQKHVMTNYSITLLVEHTVEVIKLAGKISSVST